MSSQILEYDSKITDVNGTAIKEKDYIIIKDGRSVGSIKRVTYLEGSDLVLLSVRWCDGTNSSIWSNDVRKLEPEELI